MIYDCFMLHDELDMLEIRLNILAEAADRFVLVEATTTHSGLPKPLYYEQNKGRFTAFRPQLIHVIASNLPIGEKLADGSERAPANRWPAENAQRNAILRGLELARDEDWAVVADIDEIWNPAALPAVLTGPMTFETEVRGGCLNSPVLGHNRNAVLASVRDLRQLSPQGLRDRNHDWPVLVGHGGWCFSWICEDEDQVRRKIASYAHAEYDNTEGREFWISRWRGARAIDPATDPTFPEYIKANIDRYRHLIRP